MTDAELFSSYAEMLETDLDIFSESSSEVAGSQVGDKPASSFSKTFNDGTLD